MSYSKERQHKIVVLLLILCLIVLAYFLLLSPLFRSYDLPDDYDTLNLVPFREIGRFITKRSEIGVWGAFSNLAGNILAFIPLGFLLPAAVMFMRKAYRTILAGLLISMAGEILQYVFAVGVCDIDDLILNTAGTAIGYAVFAAVMRIRRRKIG